MKNVFGSPTYKFLSGNGYIFVFSLVYAVVIGSLFYPGLLYSDSVVRWNLAIQVANDGFVALTGASDHHPVFPILIMALFYKVTGELGFFSITQVFFYSVLFFYLVRHFSPKLTGIFFASLSLLLPVSQVYAIFISYDSLFSIFLMGLILSLLCKLRVKFLLIPVFLATLVGTRTNSAIIIPLILILLFIQRNNFRSLEYLASILLCILLSASVLYLPTALHMQKGSSWLIGTAWEYAGMATKTKDERHINFLKSFGASPETIESDICYHGIYCGKELEFIRKINNDRGFELIRNYANIAKDYPEIFSSEKLKYIKSLMGVGYKLQNAEIGRWREKIWKDAMKPLGFETSKKKESFVNRFFDFSDSFGIFLFRPWVIFCMLIFTALFLRKIERSAIIIASIPIMYYISFFITSQNHEFRYFFPVVLIFFAYASACSAVFVSHVGDLVIKNLPSSLIAAPR